MDTARQALSFGAAAEHYDRVRPSYPAEAIRWAIGDESVRVVDLGAGTGIFSRQLAEAGHTVLPVEPDEGMRRRLAAASGLEPLAGSAEKIPLPDGSVDAVTAAQAYHWFDGAKANAEAGRVLRPGGVFCPLWNVRDESVPWVAALTQLVPYGLAGGTHSAFGVSLDFGGCFEPAERAFFPHATIQTADSLVELMRSRSYYLTAEPERQAQIEREVRELAATHPDLAGRDEFELPYVTVAYRARRLQ